MLSPDAKPSDGSLLPVRFVQEFLHIPQVVGLGVSRQRLHKNFTIGHPLNPAVEECKDAAIGLRANQAAEALFERQNRLRYLEVGEGIASLFLKSADARGHDRIAGHRE